MKRAVVFLIFLAACSNSRNELMSKLLVQKKQLLDSISAYEISSNAMLNVPYNGRDTVALQKMRNDFFTNEKNHQHLYDELKQVTFSIDSLARMK